MTTVRDGNTPTKQVMAMMRRPVPAFLLVALLYLLLSAFTDPSGYLGTDTGAKVYTLEVMDQRGSTNPDVGYWAEDLDPGGSLHPLYQTRRQSDGSWVAVTTLPMLQAAVPLYGWGGYSAALLLPMTAGALAAVAARSLARRIDPADDGWKAFWVTALASPVVIYALDFWEHTIGVACIVGAVSILIGAIEDRPPWTAVAAGVLLGSGAVMRNETLIYAFVAVSVVCVVAVRRGEIRRSLLVGSLSIVGFVGPWVANAALERSVGGQSRADRATGTATAIDPTTASSFRIGERLREALQTSVGLVSGDPVFAALLGGAIVAAIVVAVRAERRGDRTFAIVAVGAAGIVYLADAIGGLGFVPGLFIAFPVALGALVIRDRSRPAQVATAIALLALPLVYAFQYVGGAGPQWGGRYTLGSAMILGVVGLSGLVTRLPVVGRGLLALTVLVTSLGVGWVSVRTHAAADFFEELQAFSEPVVIARQAFLLREGGASIVGERWLSVRDQPRFLRAVDVAREIGEERFTVLEWDGDAPPESALPDDVVEVDRRLLHFVDTPVGAVTYEFVHD